MEYLFVMYPPDFGVRNRKRLVQSSDTSTMRREAEQLALVSNVPRLIDLSLPMSNGTGYIAHADNLILTTAPSLYLQVFVRSSNHCVITSPTTSPVTTPHPTQDTFWRCDSAGCYGFSDLAFKP